MTDRYHVGRTPMNKQAVWDDEGTVICLAITTGRAKEIARALNLVEQLGQPHVERPVPESDLIYLDKSVAEPDWSEVIVYSADVVKWLDALYWTLIDPRESGVPVPPWRQQ